MIDIGQMAPDFTLPRDGGAMISIQDFRPKRVVLFFYPRDDTSGCTTEALGFTARLQDFANAGVQVLGVSKDTVAKHQKFRDKHGLTVPLLSDADSDLCERFGVWVEKSMYGRTFMGIERSTFLIGGDGRVEHVWRKVKVPGHVDEVLQRVQNR